MSFKKTSASTEATSAEHDSTLEPGVPRFLGHVIEHGLSTGLRTPDDFIRHFTPAEIMMALKDRPDLRADILVETTGIRSKIALKKTAESSACDFQLALDEGETDAATILSLFPPDDRVRYLDATRLWSYAVEGGFWKTEPNSGDAFDVAKQYVVFILERAIEDLLISNRDIIQGITVEKLVQHLSLTELQAVIEQALTHAHSGKPFNEQDFLRTVPTSRLVEHVPLTLIWDMVIHPKVAVAQGLTGPIAPRHPTPPTEVVIDRGFTADPTASDEIGEPDTRSKRPEAVTMGSRSYKYFPS